MENKIIPLKKKTTEWLPVKLTKDEVMAKTDDMLAHMKELDHITGKAKSEADNFKIMIKKEEGIIDELKYQIRSREERRHIRCEWWLNYPEKGNKTLMRLDMDPPQGVQSTIMKDEDYQECLPFDVAEPDAEEGEPQTEEDKSFVEHVGKVLATKLKRKAPAGDE